MWYNLWHITLQKSMWRDFLSADSILSAACCSAAYKMSAGLYVNSWFNPFAYYLTNRAFREYVSCVVTCRKYRPRRASIVTSTVHENSAVCHVQNGDKPRSISLGVWGRSGGKYTMSTSLSTSTPPTKPYSLAVPRKSPDLRNKPGRQPVKGSSPRFSWLSPNFNNNKTKQVRAPSSCEETETTMW